LLGRLYAAAPRRIRGFISGGLGKKMGITVESFKSENGDRTYRVASN
jgi:hypothetical protein